MLLARPGDLRSLISVVLLVLFRPFDLPGDARALSVIDSTHCPTLRLTVDPMLNASRFSAANMSTSLLIPCPSCPGSVRPIPSPLVFSDIPCAILMLCSTPAPLFAPFAAQALQKGNNDGARIYAQNAIRKKTEGLNLLRLASRIDAVASRVETAVTMRSVTNSMGSVVKGMDKAMESMNLERVSGYGASPVPHCFRTLIVTLRYPW